MGFSLKKIGKVIGKVATGDWLGAAATVAGGVIGSKGSKKAANASIAGQQAGIDEQRGVYGDISRLQQPYMDTGTSAIQRLGRMYSGTGAPDYSEFTSSPDYQFNLKEGLSAVESGAAARGGLYSGNAMRALQERGAGIASTQLGAYQDRLMRLAGIGQASAGSVGSARASTGNNVSTLLAGQGDARASGIVGSTNAVGGAINTLGQMVGDGAFSGVLKKKPKATERLALNYIQPTAQRSV